MQIPQLLRSVCGADRAHSPNQQANRNCIRPIRTMMLTRVRIMSQFGTFPRFQDTEDQQTNECCYELWESGVDIQNAKVETGKLACGGYAVV